jgi:signal transduction histidine kinase
MWVAAELHDGPIQQLSALGFGIDRVRRRLSSGDTVTAARALEQSRDELTRIVASLRKLMSELRPPALDESGLEGALRDYVAAFRRDSGVQCSLEVALGEERLPNDVETTVYRVSQEALLNIRRHAQARNSCVTLSRSGSLVHLRIHDDGCGFDANTPVSPNQTAHYGLVGMRERVERRGGHWKVQSSPGRGTTIDAEFALEPAATTEPLMEVMS